MVYNPLSLSNACDFVFRIEWVIGLGFLMFGLDLGY